jgi:copper chaperone CopZ
MSARVLIECKGPAKEVESALSRVSGVSKVEVLTPHASADKNYNTFALRPREGQDVREEAASTVTRNGWPLREIRLEHATLEEFFVQVTAQQAQAKGQTE